MKKVSAAIAATALLFSLALLFLQPAVDIMALAYLLALAFCAAAGFWMGGMLRRSRRRRQLQQAAKAGALMEDREDFLEDRLDGQGWQNDLDVFSAWLGQSEAHLKQLQDQSDLWAHEIWVPLCVLTLHGQERSDELVLEQAAAIERSVEMMLRASRLTHRPDVDWSCLNLREAVAQAVRNSSFLLIHHDFDVQITGQQAWVCTDRSWLVFLLGQIISNAVKYRSNDRTGELLFSIGHDQSGRIRLKIRDNGQGIDAADLPYVFDKGYTSRRSRQNGRESTGFGLYLCAQTARILQMDLQIDSQAGQWTEVTLTFDMDELSQLRKNPSDRLCHV